ncbi:MAG TPA: ATP-dependent protease ATPase subunit HslU [Candidatus Micrarchaeia archaeon]|nr:ATP-dependent protease ATPase subunit HslU [Candidatus Micrarchaeia archaeon]
MALELRPAEIVAELDRYIVGQAAGKRAVAIALRNRHRRMEVPQEERDDILPSNILMIGPTGVGKTEIARRLAQIAGAPFIKVEATKFTEVGYVGRDVESIIRDLLEQTITEVQGRRVGEVEEEAKRRAEARIVERLLEDDAGALVAGPSVRGTGADPPAVEHGAGPVVAAPATGPSGQEAAPAAVRAAPGGTTGNAPGPGGTERGAAGEPRPESPLLARRRRTRRRVLARKLAARQLEDRLVEIEVEESYTPPVEVFSGTGYEEIGWSLADFFSQMAPSRKRLKRMSVADARHVLTQEETDRLVDIDSVYDDAIHQVEEKGIVFIDEVDKIAGPYTEGHGPDVSGQGVQRDLLPVIEGSAVSTRYGTVRTEHVLFIAAGAFTMAKPADLIPEFQGRFPIRVELQSLTEADLRRILVEPRTALTRQYTALLKTEGVELVFSDDGVGELAHQAQLVNERDENIGARRLFTVLERVLEDVSFSAESHAEAPVRIDRDYVTARLGDLVGNEDLRRYVL